jgi:hypothetical protein
MKRETLIWLVVFLIGGAFLVARFSMTGGRMGSAYVTKSEQRFVNVGTADEANWVDYDSPEILDYAAAQTAYESIPAEQRISWTVHEGVSQREYQEAEIADPNQSEFLVSMPRTLGIWIAAFFTLAIFSFLYKDNPFYKIAEAVVVGVSAAYWMVVGFWDVIVPNLVGKLSPHTVKAWALPGLSGNDLEANLWYIVPLILGIMLLMRLSPKGAWISRWPLAFIIGTTAGMRLIGFIQADFLSQIRASIVPLAVMENGQFSLWDSLSNLILVIGVLACLVYFFFSFEHRGVIGKTARLGIWFLMITFGAAFGYTVMGRIALLAIRLEFLFDDWLWLIDPTDKRLIVDAVALITPAFSCLGFG